MTDDAARVERERQLCHARWLRTRTANDAEMLRIRINASDRAWWVVDDWLKSRTREQIRAALAAMTEAERDDMRARLNAVREWDRRRRERSA